MAAAIASDNQTEPKYSPADLANAKYNDSTFTTKMQDSVMIYSFLLLLDLVMFSSAGVVLYLSRIRWNPVRAELQGNWREKMGIAVHLVLLRQAWLLLLDVVTLPLLLLVLATQYHCPPVYAIMQVSI